MNVWLAVVVLFAGVISPRCCCDGTQTATPMPAPAGCCGESAPADHAPCPSGGDCALEGCTHFPEAAVLAAGAFAGTPAAHDRAYAPVAEPPRTQAEARIPVCGAAHAKAVPRRHTYCVYLI